MRVGRPRFEVTQPGPFGLLVGADAELELTDGDASWSEEHFPVLELALHVMDHWRPELESFEFESMDTEDNPMLRFVRHDDGWTVTTFDKTTFHATRQEVVDAFASLRRGVDALLVDGWAVSVADVKRALRARRWWVRRWWTHRLRIRTAKSG